MPPIRIRKQVQSAIELGNGADIAFLLVVLSAYFSIFSSLEQVTIPQLASLILCGIMYLMLGIYGYALLRRYNQPLLDLGYFCLEILIGSIILMFGTAGGNNLSLIALLFLPLVVQSVLVLQRYWMLFINLLILVAYTSVILSENREINPLGVHFPLFFTAQIFIVFFTQMAVNESRSRKEVERLVVELEDANDHLRSYALKVEELAVTQERNRMAREIHDGLGHYLTSIHIHLQAVNALLINNGSAEMVQDGINKAQNLAKNALADVRQSVSTLRSPLIGHLPLSLMIQEHLAQTATGDIEVVFDVVGNEIELPPNISWTILRATQEAVNNAVKHAKCSRIKLVLTYEDHLVSLVVEDDGIGSENAVGGYGLIGLQERIHLLNGELTITTAKAQGFRVAIGVPIL